MHPYFSEFRILHKRLVVLDTSDFDVTVKLFATILLLYIKEFESTNN